MSEPFLGELKLVSFNFPPKGWAACDGQMLPINQNQALFALLGTMYGGNGQTNFALPDLRGRVAMHVGSGYVQGQVGGEPAHTLTTAELPAHIHQAMATQNAANDVLPGGNVFGTVNGNAYALPAPSVPLRPATMTPSGGSQPHENMPPYSVLMYLVALQGIFPSRN